MLLLKRILILIIILIPFKGLSVDIDTITDKIIVLNEGYDRVSAIKTSTGIVIIDTHKSTIDMGRMKKCIIEYFNDSSFIYVINTHECLEHISGNSLFPEAQKIAHANFLKTCYPDSTDSRIAFLHTKIPELERKIRQTDDSSRLVELLRDLDYFQTMKADFIKAAVPPDISFTDKLTVDLEDITLELNYIGRGAHGNCGILIYVPEEKTLFTGSTLTKPPIIYKTGDWIQVIDIVKWISVLDEFLHNSELEHIVASHVSYYTRQELQEMRDYFDLIFRTVKIFRESGKTQDAVMAELDYDIIDERFVIFTEEEQWRNRHYENVEILWDYME